MKLLIDNNLSFKLKKTLSSFFEIVVHVSDFEMEANTEDKTIWKYGKENDFIILSKDNDFETLSRFFGCPPKVIQLICGNKSTVEIIEILNKSKDIIRNFDMDKENCLLFLS
nr:DUF5615 family PIN-like protein [Bacteroidota bacterium]